MRREMQEIFEFAAGLSACLVAAGLYQAFGFIGVAVLGLMIASSASRLDLEDGRGVGGGNETDIYAS